MIINIVNAAESDNKELIDWLIDIATTCNWCLFGSDKNGRWVPWYSVRGATDWKATISGNEIKNDHDKNNTNEWKKLYLIWQVTS